MKFLVYDKTIGGLYIYWDNFINYCFKEYDNNKYIPIITNINNKLEKYNSSYDSDTTMLSFETEEDYMRFVLEWS